MYAFDFEGFCIEKKTRYKSWETEITDAKPSIQFPKFATCWLHAFHEQINNRSLTKHTFHYFAKSLIGKSKVREK